MGFVVDAVEDRAPSGHHQPMASTETGLTAGLVAGAPKVGTTGTVPELASSTVFEVLDLDFYYGSFQALRKISIGIPGNEVTALIGPSGCGKSTFLRCLNRMNDLIPGARVDGVIEYHG